MEGLVVISFMEMGLKKSVLTLSDLSHEYAKFSFLNIPNFMAKF